MKINAIAKSGIQLTAAIAITTFVTGAASAAPPSAKSYSDHRGGTINFPLGDISFADEIVSYKKGNPAPDASLQKPEVALGAPDYIDESHEGIKQADCPLGAGGELVLRFVDNALIDVPGPDLFVFEVGPAIEATDLAISPDGKKWVAIGKIEGSTAAIDIHKFVKPGEVFHYVKVTDLKQSPGGAWSGADIDSVGAIGAAEKISFDAAVLFDFDKSTIKAKAAKELHEAALRIKQVPGAQLVFEGHTDNAGTDTYNRTLSTDRARAVCDYLVAKEGIKCKTEVVGYGELRPLRSNDTEQNRAKNRRVELVILPPSAK